MYHRQVIVVNANYITLQIVSMHEIYSEVISM